MTAADSAHTLLDLAKSDRLMESQKNKTVVQSWYRSTEPLAYTLNTLGLHHVICDDDNHETHKPKRYHCQLLLINSVIKTQTIRIPAKMSFLPTSATVGLFRDNGVTDAA